jgi:hypothetical protein
MADSPRGITSIFYDALGRLEPKMIIGVPLSVVAVCYGMLARDWVGFGAMFASALGLMGFTTAGDAAIDKAQIAAEAGKCNAGY